MVRTKAGTLGGRQRYTDVLGQLCGVTAQEVQVRRDNGELITIATSDIVAAKQIPPRISRPPKQPGQ